MTLIDLYYHVRPFIPRSLQIRLRRFVAGRQLLGSAGVWPILESAGVPPRGWQGWPEGKRFALVLTHDVESQAGHDRCRLLMDLEERLGFRSCFNIVPELYKVSPELRGEMVSRGFEVGVHGLHHDGHLFRSREIFERSLPKVNRYLKHWNAVGFRSPSMLRNLKWIGEFDIEYDSSTFDTDPFEPHPLGAGTVFPFLVERVSGAPYVELPYTLPQDSTLFMILNESSSSVWEKKLDWIAEKGGMALVNAHPDYMRLDAGGVGGASYEAAVYEKLLSYAISRYRGQYWHALPREVARFVTERCRHSDTLRQSCVRTGRREVQRSYGGRERTDVWIDLDNTPHVPFFKPIIRELESRGVSVVTTARDAYQVCDVAVRLNVPCIRTGHHYGRNKAAKLYGTIVRAFQLWGVVRSARPRLAISHGSRSQLITSRLMGIPSVLIADYEYATSLPVFRPSWFIAPEVLRDPGHDFPKGRFLHYPGIKEDVYAPDFRPDPLILSDLGIGQDGRILVTVRPPATEAHYHNPESEPLFFESMRMLCGRGDVEVVLLPRNERQGEWCRKELADCFATGRVLIPDRALDGLNLIWHSDLVISGGGTMNREAAALGVPVYSIFRGAIGAVDRHLAGTGRLILLETTDDVHTKIAVKRRAKDISTFGRNCGTIEVLVGQMLDILGNPNRSDRGH